MNFGYKVCIEIHNTLSVVDFGMLALHYPARAAFCTMTRQLKQQSWNIPAYLLWENGGDYQVDRLGSNEQNWAASIDLRARV